MTQLKAILPKGRWCDVVLCMPAICIPAGVKALLNDMGMIENVLRLPLVPTTITTKQKMADILKELNF